ncbi:MAG: hypothetical protein CW691_09145 [Candidatus Bathyarchaeum sp.]|nr:MAG: hypothetical protein CW691_09145 [Candidatus Bathyarchaeum sp.]
MPDTFRAKSWQHFKELAYSKNPKCVVYVIAQSVPARDHTGLKLILPVQGAQYIFTDTAKGDTMRRTGIPVRTDKKGSRFLTDEDVKRFLRTELQIKNLQIFSYWTA